MAASLHVSLPETMRAFVDKRASFATPSEYIRDLIRKDMERVEVYQSILRGVDEAERGDFAPEDFLEKLKAEYK
ncbi:hypothetical protein PQU92_04340 [Asticcacaulis sp. BYS171W]|uniref:CopG family transcriptional regulator n=1 Tax=Asticcacaulis aquaticus TaxID=2984212 RepID=A0ABT5HSQ1_9CAUL|nr:hypothetical protein [Asticcacaulis aquaticus]MDC7682491.1 hypothetical protein [Asticcacaulis aquaticus]